MANDTRSASTDDLDDLAFQIFSQAVAAHPAKRGGEREAIDAYRKAESFLTIRKRVRAGDLKPKAPEGVQLADCCAPNLPRTHPLNLVAKVYQDRKGGPPIPGDLARVQKLKEWLDRNPTPESDPQQVCQRLQRDFSDLGWGLPEINVARDVFPAYCKN